MLMIENAERLKPIIRDILLAEQEKATIEEDIKYKKNQMKPYLPQGGVNKAIKVYMMKGFDNVDILDYREISCLLGIPFACEVYQPTEEIPEGLKQNREEITNILSAYATLAEEKRDLQEQISDLYKRAKILGVSVPLLKKAVDFCLHPDKLEAFREDCPLLESYVDISREL